MLVLYRATSISLLISQTNTTRLAHNSMRLYTSFYHSVVVALCLWERGLGLAAATDSASNAQAHDVHQQGGSTRPTAMRNHHHPKLDSVLNHLVSRFGNDESGGGGGGRRRRLDPSDVPQGLLINLETGTLLVEVRGTMADNAALKTWLQNDMGLIVTQCFRLAPGRCSVQVPLGQLSTLAATPQVQAVSANVVQTNNSMATTTTTATTTGLVDSLASQSMWANQARDIFHVDGSGVKVCVMSDSFDCAKTQQQSTLTTDAAQDVALGDLPPFHRMDIVRDLNAATDDFFFCSDEGRAMMQLIHDVAPGAELGFYSAFLGLSSFAEGILELVHDAKCDVIVDDILYRTEAMFQDDLIAQAVNYAHDMGVTYFSSSGNLNRFSWDGPWEDTSLTGDYTTISTASTDFSSVLDFGDGQGGSTAFLTISAPFGAPIVLQWADPKVMEPGLPGPQTDLDLYAFAQGTTTVYTSSTNDNVVLGHGYEYLLLEPGTYDLVIDRVAGPPPDLVKIVGLDEIYRETTNGDPATLSAAASYGHANAQGAMGVVAASYQSTPGFGVSPAIGWTSNSAGGVPILFDTAGNRLWQPEVRANPAFTGPDGTCTNFFGFQDAYGTGDVNCYNFFGSSAAAPSVAAVAALLLDAQPRLQPDQVRAILSNTAEDMDDPNTPWFDFGYDQSTGRGFINALYAVGDAALPLSKIGKTKGMKSSKRKNGSGKSSNKIKSKKKNGRGERSLVQDVGHNSHRLNGSNRERVDLRRRDLLSNTSPPKPLNLRTIRGA